MSIDKHLNQEYSGGIPLNVGDRFYSQDMGRDFNYLQDRMGEIGKDIIGELPFIVSGGVVSKGGSADEMNITPCVGYAKHSVTIPDTFAALPPSTTTADIETIRVKSTQQTNLDISGATLDGSTLNYVKLRYDDADGNTRARAKKAGSYNYEQTPSFTIVVDTVAPTDYDIVLLGFKWDGVLANVLEVVTGYRSPELMDLLAIKSRQVENDIINGGMNIWQEGTGFAAIATGVYTAEGFPYTKVGAMIHTVSRDTDVPGVSPYDVNYSLKIDCTTVDAAIAAGDFCTIGQKIEGYNFKKYVGGYGTLSFWVKGTKTGVHCVSFRNSVADRSYVAEFSINATATWEYKTITIPLDYSGGTWDYVNGIGLEISWALAVGSTFQTTPGTWQTGDYLGTADQVNACDNTANDFFITKPKFELGQVATPFVNPPISKVIERCQRHFEKSYSIETVAGTSTATGLNTFRLTNLNNSDSTMRTDRSFKVSKRVNPTVLTYSQTGTLNRVDVATGEVVSTVDRIGEQSFAVEAAMGGAATSKFMNYHWTADARL